jgi:pentatricopeptide repeat protein
MQVDGVECNTISYNALIAAFGRAGKLESALEALEQMVAAGACVRVCVACPYTTRC